MADVTIGGLTDAALPVLGTDKMIVSRNGTTLNDTAVSNLPVSTATQTALDLKVNTSALTESVQDIIGTSVVAGTNVTVTYNDTTGQTTIASSGGGEVTPVQIISSAPASPLPSGNYILNSTTAPFTITLAQEVGTWVFVDAYNKTHLNNVTLGTSAQNVINSLGVSVAMPLVMNVKGATLSLHNPNGGTTFYPSVDQVGGVTLNTNTFTQAQRFTETTIDDTTGAVNVSLLNANSLITLDDATTTFTFTDLPTVKQYHELTLVHSGSATHAIAWGANACFDGGASGAPAIPATAGRLILGCDYIPSLSKVLVKVIANVP